MGPSDPKPVATDQCTLDCQSGSGSRKQQKSTSRCASGDNLLSQGIDLRSCLAIEFDVGNVLAGCVSVKELGLRDKYNFLKNQSTVLFCGRLYRVSVLEYSGNIAL